MPGGRAPTAVLALVGAAVMLVGCGVTATDTAADDGAAAKARSAGVGAWPSGGEDDFIVFLAYAGEPLSECSATLLAPNLVVTAKHCVYEFSDAPSVCDQSGDPQQGSPGGHVTSPRPLDSIRFYAGADGRERFVVKQEAPDAVAKVVLDDKTTMLCSHDLAYVVLDKPLTGRPIAKMRLGKRPEEGTVVSAAGWGQVERGAIPRIRQRRDGMKIRRVGPARPSGAAGGAISPRTFETGPGPCNGDSGGSAYDPQSGVAFGVIARALNLDSSDPDSPCLPEIVDIVYVVPNDFPDLLRAAFTEAKAEPWLEGAAAAGYARFGASCTNDLECEGAMCVGATDKTPGTCNLDSSRPAAVCPSGHACGAGAICEKSTTPVAGGGTADPTGQSTQPADPETNVSGCSTARGSGPHAGAAMLGIAALFGAIRRSRRRREAGR